MSRKGRISRTGRMSRTEELKVIKSRIEAELGRPLVKREITAVEVAYDAGITDGGDIIDFMYRVMESRDGSPYELISDYMDIL